MATPALEKIAAIEVKATLQAGRWPRLAPVRMNQMTPDWLDKLENSGMVAVDLKSADVYGVVAMVQFSRRQFKAAVTSDFVGFAPVSSLDELEDISSVLNTGGDS
jgi:hypothetical protein